MIFKEPLYKKVLPGYVFKKWIFRTVYVFTILLWIVSIWGLGRTNVYVKCPDDAPSQCRNPFVPELDYFEKQANISLASCDVGPAICSKEFLAPGESLGNPPSLLFKYFTIIMLSIYALAFLLNHLLYNREYKFLEDKDGKKPN